MDPLLLKRILEAVLLAAAQPLSLSQLAGLFTEEEAVDNEQIGAALAALAEDCAERGIELKEVASGFRYQIREDVHPWVTRLWTERQTKYSRALLETLALIAYRQPITRAEIEQIRGVAVSSSIIKTLEEREWVRVVGYRDVPGRPALFGTSRNFLDYFNLKSLDELPPLAEIRDLDEYDPQLDLAPVVPPSLELPPEDQEAMAAEAAAEAAAAGGGETGADMVVTDETGVQAAAEAGAEPAPATDADRTVAAAEDSDSAAATGEDSDTAPHAVDSAEAEPPEADGDLAKDSTVDEAAPREAGISDEAAATNGEGPDDIAIADADESAAAAAPLDDDESDAQAEASVIAGTSEETEEAARPEETGVEAEASRESEESISDESRSRSTASESTGSGSDDPTDTIGSDAAALEPEDSAANPRGARKPYPAPSAHAPDDTGEDFSADAFADAPEADDDWSAERESALDSDDTPDFADSDFSPDDEDVDPPETTTSDDVPEHNA